MNEPEKLTPLHGSYRKLKKIQLGQPLSHGLGLIKRK
jgi:hypothetical protein